MFTVHYKGFPVECDTALEVVGLITAIETPIKEAVARKPWRKPTRATPSKAEKAKRNAKARAAYKKKQEEKKKGTTTTSRLEALPSKKEKPSSRNPAGFQKRARTSAAVISTLKRSPSPLTLDEIDTDLEKIGWPYKGQDRKGAIRATLARLKANGTVSEFLRGTGLDAMKMFRLERTNGDVESPVEQLMNGKDKVEPITREQQTGIEEMVNKEFQDDPEF